MLLGGSSSSVVFQSVKPDEEANHDKVLMGKKKQRKSNWSILHLHTHTHNLGGVEEMVKQTSFKTPSFIKTIKKSPNRPETLLLLQPFPTAIQPHRRLRSDVMDGPPD